MRYNLQVLFNRRPMQEACAKTTQNSSSSQLLASEDSYQHKGKKKQTNQHLKICTIPVSQISFAKSSNHQTSTEAMLTSH